MDCTCPPIPSPSGCTPYTNNTIDCDKISMYLGERYIKDQNGDVNLHLYRTISTVKNGKGHEDFIIDNYSCNELIEANILPPTTINNGFDRFSLTERELLSTGTFEGWWVWCLENRQCNPVPFGIKVAKALNFKLDKSIERTASMWDALQQRGDTSGIAGQYVSLIDDLDIDAAAGGGIFRTEEDRRHALLRIRLCYEWLKEIYTTYYGKKFLVKVGETSPKGDNHVPFKGICVKDNKGKYPDRNLPFAVRGDGNGQGYSISDQTSSSGGYPKSTSSDVLGLNLDNQISWVVEEDGRIQCFVKFGQITDQAGTQPVSIVKFNTEWVVNLSNLDPSSFYVQQNTDENHFLYIKASVDDVIYFTDDGQYALITLNDLVPLELKKAKTTILDCVHYFVLLDQEKQKSLNDYLTKKDAPIAIGSGIIPLPFGARGNSSQLNLLKLQAISILPAGVAVPMKSNIFSYGPYFYSANATGGTEVIVEDALSPWNFSKVDDKGIINTSTAYDTMNCVGKALAKDGAVGLQQLEKGKITVASWPSFDLGHSVDTVKNGPTLLTDINVDYGAGGVTTTYNFETYTPRFGRPAKHILDSWSESIKQIQSTNRYLKEQQLKALRMDNQLKQGQGLNNVARINRVIENPDFQAGHSPDRLLISGYYVDLKSGTNYWLEPSTVTLNNSNVPDPQSNGNSVLSIPDCDPCNPSPGLPITSSPYPSASPPRIYAFSETHKAYQGEFVQNTYSQLSIFSLDGFFLPVSLSGDDKEYKKDQLGNELPELLPNYCRVPRFALKVSNDGSYDEWFNSDTTENDMPGFPNPSSSRYSMPPFKIPNSSYNCYALPINQLYLNPILSKKILKDQWTDQRKNNTEVGFVISSIAWGKDFDDYRATHTEEDELKRQEQENFRFSALRGPLVLQAWGYDLNGKPVPNYADTVENAQTGRFRKVGLTDKFLKDWIQNPRTWPVGPVDLRWDRERGVWVAPNANKIVVARLKESLNPGGKAQAELINPKAGGIRFYENFDLSGPNGENIKLGIKSTIIEVYDFLGVKLCPCDIVYAYYDDNRYIVLESSRTYQNGGDYVCSPCTTTTTINLAYNATTTTTTTTNNTTNTLETSTPTQSALLTTTPTESIPTATETPTEVTPTYPTAPTAPTPTISTPDCWCGLDCLKTLQGYDPCKTQALIHKDGCLQWEDIVYCDPYSNEEQRKKEEKCREEQKVN